MEVRFWGTRGSLPTPGPRTVRFGGNTACVEVRTGAGHVFIFDCGTGARPLGDALPARAPIGASILFSHTHWDHIQGFPFFTPAFDPRNTIALYGPQGERPLHETLARQMELSYFRSEEHTSELQSLAYLVCRLLLEKKKKKKIQSIRLRHTDVYRSENQRD